MVFVKKNATPTEPDLTIAGMRGLRPKAGHVGIEVECEGTKLPQTGLGNYWAFHRDGSLRGTENAEYVLTRPISFDKVEEAVRELWAKFKETGTKLDESVRTSTHVHLNVLPFYQNRLASLLALWFIFEEPLSFWCGEHRAGNLFCIRAKDGPVIIEEIKNWFENKGSYALDDDSLHYSALNVGALYKFGSVEVRTMRGVTEPGPLLQWVRILKKIYDASEKYVDPRTLVEEFSLNGPVEFFRSVFEEEADGILREIGDLNLRQSLFEGMRFAQDFVYVRDWSIFNPVKITPDPFGRKTKKVANVREDAGRIMDNVPFPGGPIAAPRAFNTRWTLVDEGVGGIEI